MCVVQHAAQQPDHDAVEEVVSLPGGHDLRILRPREPEAHLDEDAFGDDEFVAYWADLWPSARALAAAIAPRALRGRRVLELGCGLALPSVVAAQAGGRVLATDWADDALRFATANAVRNGVTLETLRCSWAAPAPMAERGPFDLVLAADVLYERRDVEPLLAALEELVAPLGEAWIADPGRAPAGELLARLVEGGAWWHRSAPDPGLPRGAVHHLSRVG